MKNSLRCGSYALLLACTLGTLGGCAPLMFGGAVVGGLVATDRRTAGTVVEDEGIEVKSAMRIREHLGDSGHVNVTAFNRQVLLTGEVSSAQDKQAVEKTVAGVDNVRSIVNELEVLGNSSFTQRSNDSLVTGRVKAAIVDASDLFANSFKVVTERGTVYLMGRVTEREAKRATEIVRGTTGVQKVVRVLEVISEEELARLLPPPPAPKK